RLIHARVRADEPVARLHDEHALVLAHDPTTLAQDDLDEARIALDLLREPPGLGRRRDVAESDDAPLGLGDDLLAHYEEIACGERRLLDPRRLRDEPGEILAHSDLGQAFDADHFIARRHPSASGALGEARGYCEIFQEAGAARRGAALEEEPE